jgi:hypothetical protein
MIDTVKQNGVGAFALDIERGGNAPVVAPDAVPAGTPALPAAPPTP